MIPFTFARTAEKLVASLRIAPKTCVTEIFIAGSVAAPGLKDLVDERSSEKTSLNLGSGGNTPPPPLSRHCANQKWCDCVHDSSKPHTLGRNSARAQLMLHPQVQEFKSRIEVPSKLAWFKYKKQ